MLRNSFLILLFLSMPAWGQNTKPLIATDGATQTCNTTRMVFSPGNISCAGSVATISGGASIGSPITGSSPNEIYYADTSGNLAQSINLQYNNETFEVGPFTGGQPNFSVDANGNTFVGAYNQTPTTPATLVFGAYYVSDPAGPSIQFNTNIGFPAMGQADAETSNLRIGIATGSQNHWGTFGAGPYAGLLVDGIIDTSQAVNITDYTNADTAFQVSYPGAQSMLAVTTGNAPVLESVKSGGSTLNDGFDNTLINGTFSVDNSSGSTTPVTFKMPSANLYVTDFGGGYVGFQSDFAFNFSGHNNLVAGFNSDSPYGTVFSIGNSSTGFGGGLGVGSDGGFYVQSGNSEAWNGQTPWNGQLLSNNSGTGIVEAGPGVFGQPDALWMANEIFMEDNNTANFGCILFDPAAVYSGHSGLSLDTTCGMNYPSFTINLNPSGGNVSTESNQLDAGDGTGDAIFTGELTTSHNTLDDGSGNSIIAGTLTALIISDDSGGSLTGGFITAPNGANITTPSFSTGVFNNYAGIVKNCASSGTVTWYIPERGTQYKVIVGYASACLGASASFTYLNAFAHTPACLTTNELSCSLLTTLSTSAVVLTGTTTTGYIFIEGT